MYDDAAEYYDRIFPYNPEVVTFITGYLAQAPARVLDIGCGTGKYTAALAHDHHATGIDPDTKSIALARRNHPGVDFRTGDLLAFEEAGPFDLIFCIGNVIAHIPPDTVASFIIRVYTLLRPGGTWIVHTLNWDAILTKESYSFPVIERAGLAFTRHYHDIRPEGLHFDTAITDAAGARRENRVTLYPLTAARLRTIHQHFIEVDAFADYAGRPFTPDAMSQVRVYRR